MSLRRGQISIPLPNEAAPVSLWKWQRGAGASKSLWREGAYANLMAQVPTLQESYDSITITRKIGAWFRLEAAQADDNLTEVFEVLGSHLSQSKLFNLRLREQFIAAGLTSPSESISKVAAAVQRYKSEGTGSAADYQRMVATVTAEFAAGAQLDLALRFMDDLDQNGDTTVVSQYSFQRSISMSERAYLENGSTLFSGIYRYTDQIFTEAELRFEEAIPDEFPLPPSVLNNNAPALWLKQPTKCTQTNNRRTVTTEYLFADEWSTLYFR